VEPRSFFDRSRAERVFSPNEALPAPITTILVGRVINFSQFFVYCNSITNINNWANFANGAFMLMLRSASDFLAQYIGK